MLGIEKEHKSKAESKKTKLKIKLNYSTSIATLLVFLLLPSGTIYTRIEPPFVLVLLVGLGEGYYPLDFDGLAEENEGEKIREDLEMIWKIFQERFASSKPKNFSDDFLLTTLKTMFEKSDVEAQMILLVERRYPLTRFALYQMLNNVRLEVEEESEVSLEYSDFFGVDAAEDFKEYTLRDYYCLLKTYSCLYKLKLLDNAADSRLRLLEERASISVMPLLTYLNLGLGELAHTKLTVELVDKIVKYPKGIAKNVLVGIGKKNFPVDFIILDMPEDIKVLLILGRPFLSTSHAKIDVFKRKITLRFWEEKIIFKSIKPASSLIKRIIRPFLWGYIEPNDLDEPLEFSRYQVDDLMPTIEEGEIVEEFRARNDARMVSNFFGYPSDCDHDKKIRIDCAYNLKFSCMTVLEDMDAYRDEGMGDVIFGKSFMREVGINAKRFEGMITIYNGSLEDILMSNATKIIYLYAKEHNIQEKTEHVNAVFTRSGKSYDLSDNPNDQQNNCKNPINFDSDDEDDEPTPQPKTQLPKPVKETPIDVIDEILEEDFDALLDEGSKILLSIEGTLLEEEIFSEFDKFIAMTADENSKSKFDTDEPPFEKITINIDYKIKTSVEEPPKDLKLKPLPNNF
nr:hypothetical protein [Tanacetum cinerariifolium]